MANLEDCMHLDLLNAIEGAENELFNERRILNRIDAFQLSEKQFIKLFRLSKKITADLIDLLEPYIIPAKRSSALTVKVKVLTALRFYASGSYQTDIGMNVYTAVSQSSVSRCVKEVSVALNNNDIFNAWVTFPRTLQELQQSRNSFYEKFEFPGVVGCIDCTHIAIIAPKTDEHVFVNRKGYHSINVQLVCDSNLKIINCNARYPGSTNDSFIWNSSSLKDYFVELHKHNMNYFLLGDSGYALRSYLQTPIINPEPEPNTPEYRYNTKHMSTRSMIERCNGVLKMRFRCLLKHRVLHYEPAMASKIINACIILHNMCIVNNVPDPDEENMDDLDVGLIVEQQIDVPQLMRRVNPELAKGREMQQNLIQNYFL